MSLKEGREASQSQGCRAITMRPQIFLSKGKTLSKVQWRVPLIPAFGRQKQAELCEFDARTAREKLCLKKPRTDKHTKGKTATQPRGGSKAHGELGWAWTPFL